MIKLYLLLSVCYCYVLPAQTIVSQPRWSPDGNKILYIAEIDGNYEIYTIDKDGGNNNRLTFTDALEENASFSCDGNKMLYESNANGFSQIYIMNADGSNQRNISNSNNNDLEPNWSPTCNKIAFRSLRDGTSQIYIMDVDGLNCHRLSDLNYNNSSAIWSPDGTKLVCKSIRLPNFFKNSLLDLIRDTALILNLDYKKQYDCDYFTKDSKKIICHQSLVTMLSPSGDIEMPKHVFYLYDVDSKTSSVLKKGLNSVGYEDSILLSINKIKKQNNSLYNELSQAEFSSASNLFVFHDSQNIYTVKPDGSDMKNLTKK